MFVSRVKHGHRAKERGVMVIFQCHGCYTIQVDVLAVFQNLIYRVEFWERPR